jgi:GH18 family chitinase
VFIAVAGVLLYLYFPTKKDPLSCTSSADCAATQYCSKREREEGDPESAVITGTCVDGCDSDAACGAYQTCTAEHLCQGRACLTNSDCVKPQTCAGTSNAYKKKCTGQPLLHSSAPLSNTCIAAKEVGLCVRSTVRVLLAIGVPATKIVVGVTLNGTSVFPAPNAVLYTPIDKGVGELYPGPAFTAGDVNDGKVEQLDGVDFTPRPDGLLYTNEDVNPDSWYNVWAFVAADKLLFSTKWGVAARTVRPDVFDDVVGGLFMSFETVGSLSKKVEYVREAGLGGLYVDKVEGDSSRRSLVGAAVATRLGTRTGTSGGASAVRRVVGYVSATDVQSAQVQSWVGNYTHVNVGPFTISYQRGDPSSNPPRAPSFYVDSTDAEVDFGSTVVPVTCGAWPATSSDDAKPDTCIAPRVRPPLPKKDEYWPTPPPVPCVPPNPNSLLPVGSDEWTCWNDQPGRTCHTGGVVSSDTCEKRRKSDAEPELQCIAAGSWCGRLAAKNVLKLKNPSGVKVLMSLGGAQDSAYFSIACSDPFRDAFVSSICAWITTFEFDGVDIRWQYPLMEKCDGTGGGRLPPELADLSRSASSLPECPAGGFTNCAVCGTACLYAGRADDASRLLALLRDLRGAIQKVKRKGGEPRPLLSATISVQAAHLKAMDYGAMSRYVDYFNVECFNFNDGTTGIDPVLDVASPLDVFCGDASGKAPQRGAPRVAHCNTASLHEKCGPPPPGGTGVSGVCVECATDGDCAAASGLRTGSKCDTTTNTCYCAADSDCTRERGRPACGELKRCVACTVDSECAPGLRCDVASGTCVACTVDSECPPANKCDATTNTCVPQTTAFNNPMFTYHQAVDSITAPFLFDNWPLENVDQRSWAPTNYGQDRQKYYLSTDLTGKQKINKNDWDEYPHTITFKDGIEQKYDYKNPDNQTNIGFTYKPEKFERNGYQTQCCVGGDTVTFTDGPLRNGDGTVMTDKDGKPMTVAGDHLDATKCLAGRNGYYYIEPNGRYTHLDGKDPPQYWLPWSPGCDDSEVVTQYCVGTDSVTGKSNLIADANCTAWCLDPKNREACDGLMTEYCAANPTASECACQYYAESPFYTSFMSQLKTSAAAASTLGVALDNPACWVPACEGSNLVTVLRPTGMEAAYQKCLKANPGGRNMNICTQIIDVAGSDNVQIDDLEWTQVCGDYPNPSNQTCKDACSNDNVCRFGECGCASSPYPCTGNAVCGATGCVDTCADDNNKSCTRNNACSVKPDGTSTCVCGGGEPCGPGEFCQLDVCVPDCLPHPRFGERCVGGATRCGAGPGCADYETCEYGTCRRTCGTCLNGTECDRVTGTCKCGTRLGGCPGTQQCTVDDFGESVCTSPSE